MVQERPDCFPKWMGGFCSLVLAQEPPSGALLSLSYISVQNSRIRYRGTKECLLGSPSGQTKPIGANRSALRRATHAGSWYTSDGMSTTTRYSL